MNNKYLYLIPPILLEFVLQLLFFWLAPGVPCYWTVYAFGTTVSILHIALVFIVGTTYGVRRSAATVSVSSIFLSMFVMVCVILLTNGADVKNALFSLIISVMVYAALTILLVLSIEKNGESNNYAGAEENLRKQDNLFVTGTKGQEKQVNMAGEPGINRVTTPPPLPVRK